MLGKIGSGSFGEIYECTLKYRLRLGYCYTTQNGHQARNICLTLRNNKKWTSTVSFATKPKSTKFCKEQVPDLIYLGGVCKVYGSGSQDGVNYLVI